MQNIKAYISGMEANLPDYVLTNQELETMVDTNDEWIRTRTGILERRILKEKEKGSSSMAIPAVKRLLEKKNINPEDIDLVLCATVTPDMQFPATANIISAAVGAKNAFGFDIEAACSSFLYGLETARRYVESGAYKKVLLVGVDKMSSIVDYNDRNTCIIFGDGCGVALIEPTEDLSIGIHDSILRSDGNGAEFLHQKAGGSVRPATQQTIDNNWHYIYQDGRPVFKRAVSEMANVTEEIMQKNGLTNETLDWLVPHQANLRIIDATRNRANLPPEKVMINIQKYGNTTSATIPLCLYDWENQLRKGDKLVITTFGGGFTWGAMYLTWGY